MNTNRDMHFYTTEKISGRKSRTPEGYLLVQGVPLARTGMMIYGPDETPIPPGPDGLVYVERTPDQVFRTETIASANGKAICNDHPPVDVSPENWRTLSLGVIMNPRRGSGIEDDFLIGDLLIQDQEGIRLVESGKVELSMGYDSGYVMTGPGRGYQKDIIYNHVALVDKGRCGPRCSIGDRTYVQEKPMLNETGRTADRKPKGVLAKARDRLLGALRSGRTIDEEMLEETLGDSESEEVATGGRQEPVFVIHNHHGGSGDNEMARAKDEEKEEKKELTEDRVKKMIGDALDGVLDALDKRLAKFGDKSRDKDNEDDDEKTEDNEKILGALELEAPPGTNDRARKARDSSFLADSFRETVALAEVLAPGIRVPTFDSKSEPAKSLDTICNLRRTALDVAYHADAAVRGTIDAIGGAQYKTMDCIALRPVFLAAAEFKKQSNNGASRTADQQPHRSGGAVGGARLTLAQINKRNHEYYDNQKRA